MSKPRLVRNGGILALTGTDIRPGVTRVGTVGAYTTGSDLELVRHVRGFTGRVTVYGKPGLRALASLAKAGDLYGVDLDPAGYLGGGSGQGELFGIAWEAEQRRLRSARVVRSAGVFVDKADAHASLKQAFSLAVDPGTVRVMSLHGRWLERGCSRDLLRWVRGQVATTRLPSYWPSSSTRWPVPDRLMAFVHWSMLALEQAGGGWSCFARMPPASRSPRLAAALVQSV